MTPEDGFFLLEVVGEDLVEVELDGAFYAMSGPEAVMFVLDFLDSPENLDRR